MIPAILILSLSNLILAGVIFGLNDFWTKQVQKLVDKVMSRNYAEYMQAQKPSTPINRLQIPVEEREDLGALQDLHI